MAGLTIKQASKLVDLPTKTIRFYEDSGVIDKAIRASNGYRHFSPKATEQLKLIKYARDLGLPLAEIKKLMRGCSGHTCKHTQNQMKNYIDNYVALLEKKIAQFKDLKYRFKNLKKGLTTPVECKDDDYCCNLLQQLVNNGDQKGGELL